MRNLSRVAAGVGLAMGIALASGAQAHGFWFAQRVNQLAMVFGAGTDDLDVVKRLPRVKSFAAYDEDGKEVESKLVTNGPMVFVNVDNQPAIVTGVMDYGLWSKTPDGKWHSKGHDEVPNAIVSTKNWKYAVHLRRDLGKPVPVLPGQRLQIVPVTNPLPLKRGMPLELKALFDGKPLAGALVHPDFVNDIDGERPKTNKDGTFTIKVRNQGLNVIGVTYDGPPEDPAKTWKTEHFATLSFILPHEPE